MKLLPDTNALVYETVEDSEHHATASKIIEEANAVYIPTIVLYEYIWVMLKLSVDPEFISLKLNEYYENPKIRFIQEGLEPVTEALRNLKERGLAASDINDLIILHVAKRNDLTLLTFDKRLKALSKRNGVKVI